MPGTAKAPSVAVRRRLSSASLHTRRGQTSPPTPAWCVGSSPPPALAMTVRRSNSLSMNPCHQLSCNRLQAKRGRKEEKRVAFSPRNWPGFDFLPFVLTFHTTLESVLFTPSAESGILARRRRRRSRSPPGLAMAEDLVKKAERSVFMVRQAFSEQAYDGRFREVETPTTPTTPTGKIYIGGFIGSAFCFHKDGYLVTCEHVRLDMHNHSCRDKKGLPTEHSKPPAFVVVCPYEGGGAELDWRRSWRAEFVAHTREPLNRPSIPEPRLPPNMILSDDTDLAILRLVEPVAPACALAIPKPLRFSKKAPQQEGPRQRFSRKCWTRCTSAGCWATRVQVAPRYTKVAPRSALPPPSPWFLQTWMAMR
jgi:hypothetical protein